MEFGYATNADIDQLVELRIAYILDDQKTISEEDLNALKESLPGYFLEHLNKDCFAFVAKDDCKIVSVALLLVIEKPANPHFIHGLTGEVLSVYTKPEYRRQGLCLNLIKLLLESAKQKGLDKVNLSATNDGYPVYKKAGFADSGSDYKEMVYHF